MTQPPQPAVTWQYTFNGTEGHPSVIFQHALPTFTGNFYLVVTLSPAATNIYNFGYSFYQTGAGQSCWSEGVSFVHGDSTKTTNTHTVGSVTPPWNCTTWDTFQWTIGPDTSMPDVGMVLTVSLYANFSMQYCQYGTQPAPTAPAVTIITTAIVDVAVTAFGAPWLALLFDPIIGLALDTGVLCGTGPPPVGDVSSADLLTSIETRWSMFQGVVWYSLCQCKPGPIPPTPYTPQPPNRPPDWTPDPTYACDPANLCATLQFILRRLEQLSSQTSNILDVTSSVQRFGRPFAYNEGQTHALLVGDGTIAISRLAGVRLTLTASQPPVVLGGEPPYLWDQGWMSVSDRGAMLQQLRVTRTQQEWFPDQMQLATVFGYYLLPGTVATMTELVPEP